MADFTLFFFFLTDFPLTFFVDYDYDENRIKVVQIANKFKSLSSVLRFAFHSNCNEEICLKLFLNFHFSLSRARLNSIIMLITTPRPPEKNYIMKFNSS